MNTADRSLAMLDYALRRRFAFFEMKPGFESEGFRDYKMAFANPKFDSLIDCVEKLNAVIAADDSLGDGFCIGHSYFCNLSAITDKALSNIVLIIPGISPIFITTTNKETNIYKTANIGTITSETFATLCTPPNIIIPVNVASIKPKTNLSIPKALLNAAVIVFD